MARHRKKNQSKLSAAADLLGNLGQKTARDVKDRLGGDWRDNLFEILMTRLDFAAPRKKIYAEIPLLLRRDPAEIPAFAGRFFGTMRDILKLARAPASPAHVAAFGALYASVIDVFLKDDTRDRSKTMAALDQRLGWFEQLSDFIPCAAEPSPPVSPSKRRPRAARRR